jgi:hypothetical protein
MPYIAQKDRDILDSTIHDLSDKIVELSKGYGYDGAFAGLLNYSCTRLGVEILEKQFGNLRYWQIAILTGTFKNIADEFYRRKGVPYEDIQIEKNGDCY